MKNEEFNERDLIKLDVQYTFVHKSAFDFKPEDKIFLRSNPEVPLEVLDITKTEVICFMVNYPNNPSLKFPSECLMHYKYAAFVTIKERFEVCLN